MIKDDHIVDSKLPIVYQEAKIELEALETLNLTVEHELRQKRSSSVEEAVINSHSVTLKYDAESQIKVLQELERQGFTKVVVLVDDNGKSERYRITQANKSLIKGNDGNNLNVVNRLAPLAGKLITAELEDEIWCNSKFFGYVKLIEYVKKSPFRANDFSSFELIENDNDYDSQNKKLTNVASAIYQKLSNYTDSEIPATSSQEKGPESLTALSSEEVASLSSDFYTRTTKEQEELIQFPNSGVLMIMGVAGSGKTSVALGRVKKLRDSSYFDLKDEHYDDFFKDTSRMIGFVRHKQLVPYLKETCSSSGLDLSAMPVKEYKELQQSILAQYQHVLQLKMSATSEGKYRRNRQPYSFAIQTKNKWLRVIDKEFVNTLIEGVVAALSKQLVEFKDYPLPERLKGSQAALIKATIRMSAESFFENAISKLQIRKSRAGKWGFYSIELLNYLNSIFRQWHKLFDSETPIYITDGKLSHKRSDAFQEQIFPFRGLSSDSETVKLLTTLRQQVREKVRSSFRLSTKGSQFRFADTYLQCMKSLELPENIQPLEMASAVDLVGSGMLTDADLDILTAIITLFTWRANSEDIPVHLRENRKFTSVFIDEVQDFTELQVLNMGLQADPRRHAVTAVGDFRQQLYRDTVEDLSACFPMMPKTEPHVLTKNMRQQLVLARYSQYVRDKIEGNTVIEDSINWQSNELNRVQVNEQGLVEHLQTVLDGVGQNKSVAIICPSNEVAAKLEECLRESILAGFRESHVAENSNELNKPFYIHFTTPTPTKGLEFDIVLIPYCNRYEMANSIESNHYYVAVSRPKEQLFLIDVS